jgi:hypothetical protein
MAAMKFFLVLLISSFVQASEIVARVNGEPILEEELKKQFPELGPKEGLEKMILYKLALQQAREQGVDKRPEVLSETNKVLYRAYLKEASAKGALLPNDSELEAYYSAYPFFRLRHLVLYERNPKEKEQSEKTLEKIQASLKRNASFKTLVLKYSQDESAKFAGDLDFRGVNSLPEIFFEATQNLKEGQVSEPIHYQGAVHLLQVTSRKSFREIPATYREYLRSRLIHERELAFLKSHLQGLREKSKIVILSKEPQ